MGKRKRAQKRARREARGTEAEATFAARDEAVARRRRRWRRVLLAWPPIVAVVAGALYLSGESQLAGIALLGGAVVWFPLWLGTLGSEVAPRDRDRAGGIDFGNRR